MTKIQTPATWPQDKRDREYAERQHPGRWHRPDAAHGCDVCRVLATAETA